MVWVPGIQGGEEEKMCYQVDKSIKLTRREFLVFTGLGITALATGCRLGQRQAGRTSSVTGDILYQYNPPTAPQGVPDLILHSGKVLTVDSENTVAQAVAVKGETIQAVGTNEAVKALKGDNTKVINLKDRVLTPGMIDSHLHLGLMEVFDNLIPLLPPEIKTIKDFISKLSEEAAQTPEGEWIQAYYFVLQDGNKPTRDHLDKVSPDHPVWVIHQSGHYGYANSIALDLAGITAETQSPPGGIIERDSSGKLTGGFYNHRAMNVLRQALPDRPEDVVQTSILNWQPAMLSEGLTSFQDVFVYGLKVVEDYIQLGKDGQMEMRAIVYPVLENPRETEPLVELERYEDLFMRLGGYKLQIDGSALTSYCHEPLNGTHYNQPAWPEDVFKKVVRALHDTDLQICVHCVGDAAVDLTLDAFEEAMNANPRPDPRHRIEHCMLTSTEATQRIKDLGVVVSNTPTFMITAGDSFVKMYGEERADRIIVTREWLDAGIAMALGSDFPTTPWYNPQRTIAESMARLTITEETISPEQSLTFEESLRAQTLGSAYAGFNEDIKGTIEPGKLADLAVWNEDPTGMEPLDLATASIDKTFVGGEMAYEAG
ncbi:amidohydrolase [Chloroflexota bacterium]